MINIQILILLKKSTILFLCHMNHLQDMNQNIQKNKNRSQRFSRRSMYDDDNQIILGTRKAYLVYNQDNKGVDLERLYEGVMKRILVKTSLIIH